MAEEDVTDEKVAIPIVKTSTNFSPLQWLPIGIVFAIEMVRGFPPTSSQRQRIPVTDEWPPGFPFPKNHDPFVAAPPLSVQSRTLLRPLREDTFIAVTMRESTPVIPIEGLWTDLLLFGYPTVVKITTKARTFQQNSSTNIVLNATFSMRTKLRSVVPISLQNLFGFGMGLRNTRAYHLP